MPRRRYAGPTHSLYVGAMPSSSRARAHTRRQHTLACSLLVCAPAFPIPLPLILSSVSSPGASYSNIFVTSPSPENLRTLFELLFRGFDALGLVEHTDYEIVKSVAPELHDAVVRVNVFKTHRQTVQV